MIEVNKFQARANYYFKWCMGWVFYITSPRNTHSVINEI